MKSGIYTITNTIDGKIYVGYALRFNHRWDRHREKLRKNKHANRHLQSAWNKYSEGVFLFEVLEECEEQFLCSQENYWCNMLDVHDSTRGYNIQLTNPHGCPRHKEETKQKIAQASIGHKRLLGRKQPIEQVNKVRKTASERRGKPIVILDVNGNYITECPSKGDVAEYIGMDRKKLGNISHALKGTKNTKSVRGYILVYKSKYNPAEKYEAKGIKRKIEQWSIEGEKIVEHITVGQAANAAGVSSRSLHEAIKGKTEITYKGYVWKIER